MSTLKLVSEAERLSRSQEYDEVWCVFDRDSFPATEVNGACSRIAQLDKLAGRGRGRPRFRVAFSNEAFELWYLLHFCYMDVAVSRSTYAERLERYLGRVYLKNDPQLYAILRPHQPTALRNAERLRAEVAGATPAETCPATSVDVLVTRLNEIVAQVGRSGGAG